MYILNISQNYQGKIIKAQNYYYPGVAQVIDNVFPMFTGGKQPRLACINYSACG